MDFYETCPPFFFPFLVLFFYENLPFSLPSILPFLPNFYLNSKLFFGSLTLRQSVTSLLGWEVYRIYRTYKIWKIEWGIKKYMGQHANQAFRWLANVKLSLENVSIVDVDDSFSMRAKLYTSSFLACKYIQMHFTRYLINVFLVLLYFFMNWKEFYNFNYYNIILVLWIWWKNWMFVPHSITYLISQFLKFQWIK